MLKASREQRAGAAERDPEEQRLMKVLIGWGCSGRRCRERFHGIKGARKAPLAQPASWVNASINDTSRGLGNPDLLAALLH